MRCRLLVLATFAIFFSPSVSAAVQASNESRVATSAAVFARPAAGLTDHIARIAHRITSVVLHLVPPAFTPQPQEEDLDAPMNKLANISYYLGIAGYLGFWLLLPAAFITGIVALGQINKSGERGKSRAITGIVLGGLPIAVAVVVFSWINGQ